MPARAFTPAQVAKAKAIAAARWGDPCGGVVDIWSIRLPPGYIAAAAPAYVDTDRCIVEFNQDVSFTWEAFCSTMAHEYGNLAHVPETAPERPWELTSSHYNGWRYPYAPCVPPQPQAVSGRRQARG